MNVGFIDKANACAWRWFSRALGEFLRLRSGRRSLAESVYLTLVIRFWEAAIFQDCRM